MAVKKNTLYTAFMASVTTLGLVVNFSLMVLPKHPDSPSFQISDSVWCDLLLACDPYLNQMRHILHLNSIHKRPRYDATQSAALDTTKSFRRIIIQTCQVPFFSFLFFSFLRANYLHIYLLLKENSRSVFKKYLS